MPTPLTREELIAEGLLDEPKPLTPEEARAEGVYQPAQESKATPVSMGRSALLGAASGIPIIGGLMDEATGLTHAAYGKTFGDSKEPFWDVYRQERDLYRKEEDEAAKENPKAFYGSGLASGLASGGVLGPSGATLKALSVPAKYGLAAGIGGLDALTRSRDDLTKGEVVGAGRDVATGAAMGAGAQYVGDKLAKLPSWLGDKFKAMAKENEAKVAADAAAKVEKQAQSATGYAGSQARRPMTTDEAFLKIKELGFPNVSPDIADKIEQHLASATTAANRERALANQLKMAPYQQAAADKAISEMEQLLADKPALAAKYAKEEAAKGIMGNLSPRLKVMASRAIPNFVGPAVGAAAGQFFGSPLAGAGVGALVGTGLAATLGAPGTAMANMVRKPSFRLGMANLGMSATGALEGAFRKAAQGATPTLQASPLGKYLLDEDEAKENFKKNGG